MVGCLDSQRIDLNLHNLHVGCHTGARIFELRIFDCSTDHLARGFAYYFVQLCWYDRLHDNFVGS